MILYDYVKHVKNAIFTWGWEGDFLMVLVIAQPKGSLENKKWKLS
jgi:hypothetical protein